MTATGVLGAVGGTKLVRLRSVVPPGSAPVLLKLELGNPTGSMKDRMAVAVIRAAAEREDIRPGDTVVEYTAGTTGVSLAFVCASMGFHLHAVFSDAFSEEKRRTMEAFGAEITDVPSEGGRINEALIKAMIEGVFAGTSTGANVVVACRIAAELGEAGGPVVTIAVDSGLRYLSTKLYGPSS